MPIRARPRRARLPRRGACTGTNDPRRCHQRPSTAKAYTAQSSPPDERVDGDRGAERKARDADGGRAGVEPTDNGHRQRDEPERVRHRMLRRVPHGARQVVDAQAADAARQRVDVEVAQSGQALALLQDVGNRRQPFERSRRESPDPARQPTVNGIRRAAPPRRRETRPRPAAARCRPRSPSATVQRRRQPWDPRRRAPGSRSSSSESAPAQGKG